MSPTRKQSLQVPAGTCAEEGCPRPAQRYGLHCRECEAEIVGAVEATHGPLVGGEQSELFAAHPVRCASCGGTPAAYRPDLHRVACGRCAALARGA